MIEVGNRGNYPGSTFLPQEKIRYVGKVGSQGLALVGFEAGTGDPLVAKTYQLLGSKDAEPLFAVPLSELLSHSQEAISIPTAIVQEAE